jgi:hypothetical protein
LLEGSDEKTKDLFDPFAMHQNLPEKYSRAKTLEIFYFLD